MSLDNSGSGHVRAVLRNRDLRLLLVAGLVSQTGDWILATGIGFQVYALTGSTIASAIALLATQAPQVVFGSVAGVLVDRWDRRRVMVLVNLLLAVSLLPLFAVRDASHVWLIFVVVAVSSCLTPFFVAAEVTLLPALVDKEDLVTANAVNAQVRNVARLAGAALGGVIIATGGIVWLAVVDIASFVAAAALIVAIKHRTSATQGGGLHLVRDWVEGITVIRNSRVLVVVVFFFAITGVGEAVMGTLFAPFVQDVIGGGATAFGTILAAQAVGGIVGGLLVTAFGHRVSPKALFGWGTVLFGIGDLALFLYPLITQQVWPAIVIIALVGLPGAALFAGLLTVFQTGTDDRVRGRVYGTLVTVQNVAMLASTYVAGSVADRVGVLPVITVQGALYLVAGIVVVLALRSVADVGPASGSAAEGSDADRPELLGLLDNPANSMMLPSMSLASNVRLNTVTDPVAMRALAHPLRLKLHGLVAREGSLTAADAARQLGISHALASHHLRQLGKYGFIEPAEAGDNRAHPWRVSATNLAIKRDAPDAQAAADLLDRYTVEQAGRDLADWQDRRTADDTGWSEDTGVSSSLQYLTPDELTAVREAWMAIMRPLAERRPIGHAENRPPDAVPVGFTLVTVPLRRTEQGG